jgi:putative transposase
MTSPTRRREVVDQVQQAFGISERRACRAIEQPRSSQRYTGQTLPDEKPLTQRIIHLALKYGRYGYRRITGLLQLEGWPVNHKRVERTLAPARKCRCLAGGRAKSAGPAAQTRAVMGQ